MVQQACFFVLEKLIFSNFSGATQRPRRRRSAGSWQRTSKGSPESGELAAARLTETNYNKSSSIK